MQISKNKTMAIVITMILLSSMAFSIGSMQTAKADEVINGIPYNTATADAIKAGMKWDLVQNASSTRLLLWERYQDKIPTWTYAILSPNPVGVGQRMTIVMFNPQVPYGARDENDVRYEYKVVVTRPDGTTETLPSSGTFKSDSTGSTFAAYTPDQIGNYTFNVIFQELYRRWNFNSETRDYYGVTLLSSNRTYIVTVQQDPVAPVATIHYPLPTEYWSRPIEGQNDAWAPVSSNWLNNAHDRDFGSNQNRFQTEGIGPNSGHILWTKVTEDGGIVGGDDYFSVPGEAFNAGHQYQTRFQTQIIMHGRLTYEEPITYSGGGGDWVTVDLRTGKEIWRNDTMSPDPSFGYYYDDDNRNQHGIVNPSWIFSNNFGTAIHPRYGTTGFNVTNMPPASGIVTGFGASANVEAIGPKGEVLRYVIQNEGTSSNPNWRLYQWNSSKVFVSQSSGSRNASLYRGTFDWNISLGLGTTFSTQPRIASVIRDDVLLGSNGTLPAAGSTSLQYHNVGSSTLWALSLKPGEEGRLLWMKNFEMTLPDGSQYLYIRSGEGVFIMQHMPTLTFVAYDMQTGNKLWESEPQADINPFGYYSWVSLMNVYGTGIAYGKLFTTGYTGMVFAYDLYNGTLLWRQEAPTGGEIFKYYTLFKGTIADNKIYIGTHEHSADTPLLKGAKTRVFDVNTGEEVWSMMGWAHPGTMAIADGTLIYWNNYDHKVYAVGKGPSATTVTAPDLGVPFGSSVTIRGTVTDVSAGTKQDEQAARFPNGVPAVSDESQSQWMEYVYMQKPRPTNTTGVAVTLSVLDSNNNYREIGTTTADADGFFSFDWKPDIEGAYTVYASFAGSESYWPSHAVSSFTVDQAAPTAAPYPAINLPATEMYIIGVGIAIIIAIAIVGAIIVMMLRKRPYKIQ